eukprot:3813545-Amphidinium_carterae.2
MSCLPATRNVGGCMVSMNAARRGQAADDTATLLLLQLRDLQWFTPESALECLQQSQCPRSSSQVPHC